MWWRADSEAEFRRRVRYRPCRIGHGAVAPSAASAAPAALGTPAERLARPARETRVDPGGILVSGACLASGITAAVVGIRRRRLRTPLIFPRGICRRVECEYAAREDGNGK